MVLERNWIIYQSSTVKKNGPGRIFNFNMLFAREFLHIFICLVGIFDVFFPYFWKRGVIVCTCSVLAIMYVRNTNLSIADVTAEWNVRFNKILTNSSVVEPSWISWQAREALSIASISLSFLAVAGYFTRNALPPIVSRTITLLYKKNPICRCGSRITSPHRLKTKAYICRL